MIINSGPGLFDSNHDLVRLSIIKDTKKIKYNIYLCHRNEQA